MNNPPIDILKNSTMPLCTLQDPKPLGSSCFNSNQAGTVASKSAFLAPACGSQLVERSLLLPTWTFLAAPHDYIFWKNNGSNDKKRFQRRCFLFVKGSFCTSQQLESDAFMAIPMPCIISPASAPTSAGTLTH